MNQSPERNAFAGLITQRIEEFQAIMAKLDADAQAVLADAAGLLVDCLRKGGTIFVCGNGGSAADAQHIAGELAGRFLCDRRALACMALSVDSSVVTAIGNDYGYDYVFSRQVEALAKESDVVWCLSTSGNSPNLIEAANKARSLEAKVLGFTGHGGGRLKALCDVCFEAPADISYAIQQVHQIAYHLLCELVENACGEGP